MEKIKVVEIKEDIRSRNNEQAQSIKEELKKKKVFFLNVMSSPGSGKTTLLVNLINRLKKDFRIGVIEADIDSDVDAYTVGEATGVKVIQIHTAGACHLTCQMSYEALCALGLDGLDFVILENIGNLVCPAEFDTGAAANMVLLSVPEGEDKPLKYPLMFEVADVLRKFKTPKFWVAAAVVVATLVIVCLIYVDKSASVGFNYWKGMFLIFAPLLAVAFGGDLFMTRGRQYR